MRPSLKGFRYLLLSAALVAPALLALSAVADVMPSKERGKLRSRGLGEADEEPSAEVSSGTIGVDLKDVDVTQVGDAERTGAERRDYLLQARRLARVIEEHERALQASPDSESLRGKLVQAYRAQAEAYLRGGFIAKGEEALKRSLELAPDDQGLKQALALFEQARDRKTGYLKQARVLLDVGEYKKALDKLDILTQLFPEERQGLSPLIAQAHIGAGDGLLRDKEPSRAARHYDAALEACPDVAARVGERWVTAKLMPVWKELVDLPAGTRPSPQRLLTLERELNDILAFDPDSMHVHYTLGLVYEYLGRFQRAAAHYALLPGVKQVAGGGAAVLSSQRHEALAVVKEHPLKVSFGGEDARFLEADAGDWQEYRSEHFLIRHHNQWLTEKVAQAAELHYRRIRRRLGSVRAGGCEIFLYRDKQEYLRESGEPAWSPATTRWHAKEGGLEQKLITYQTSPQLFQAVLPHELGHVAFNESVADVKGLPLWLSEGVAVAQEPDFKHRYFLRVLADRTQTGEEFGVAELLGMKSYPPGEQVPLFYAQSWNLVESLKSRDGWQKLIELARACQQQSSPEAIRATYGLELLQLQGCWPGLPNASR